MVTCRVARSTDVLPLVELCARWQRDQVQTTSNGFLQLRYGPDTFENLVAASAVIVAEEEGSVGGYYLVNPRSTDPAVSLHYSKVQNLLAKNRFPAGSRIALGSQALLDGHFQGRGVRQLLLRLLVEHLTGRYDYLFATIPKENTRAYAAHTSDGWRVVDEDDFMYSVYWRMPVG
jgi:hypothetical protein